MSSGIQQAAVLMMAVGEEAAAEVLKYMSAKEVQRLGEAMSGLSNVSQKEVNKVLEHLYDTLNDTTSIGVAAGDYVKNVLQQALGEKKASSMVSRIFQKSETSGLDMLQWMDPRGVADAIQGEHPQIIALVLSYVDKEFAARIGEVLPREVMSDVLMRIATLEQVPGLAMKELSTILETTFDDRPGTESAKAGGLRSAADIINSLEGGVSSELLEHIRESDAALAEHIEELLFVFEDIASIADKGVQAILREVQPDTLLISLKGTSLEVREKFFSNMSRRAAELMREDLEAKGPVKVAEVEKAQKEILTVVRRLVEAGDIAVGGGSDFV